MYYFLHFQAVAYWEGRKLSDRIAEWSSSTIIYSCLCPLSSSYFLEIFVVPENWIRVPCIAEMFHKAPLLLHSCHFEWLHQLQEESSIMKTPQTSCRGVLWINSSHLRQTWWHRLLRLQSTHRRDVHQMLACCSCHQKLAWLLILQTVLQRDIAPRLVSPMIFRAQSCFVHHGGMQHSWLQTPFGLLRDSRQRRRLKQEKRPERQVKGSNKKPPLSLQLPISNTWK